MDPSFTTIISALGITLVSLGRSDARFSASFLAGMTIVTKWLGFGCWVCIQEK
jgi:hypothetical protein